MMKVEQPALGDDLLARCASRAATYDRENRFFDEDFLLAQSSSPGRNNHTVNSALRSPPSGYAVSHLHGGARRGSDRLRGCIRLNVGQCGG